MNCSIDWLLTFEGFKTFLTPLAQASWPIGLFGIAWLLRSEIRSLLPRIRTIRGAGVEAELIAEGQTQTTTSVTIPPSGFGTEYPPPHAVYSDFDNYLKGILENEIGGDAEKKLAWAIRVRSVSEVNRLHESNFRTMFGSQLKALRALNTVIQLNMSEFRQYFDDARTNPDSAGFHESRTFEAWKAFLTGIGYVIDVEGSEPPAVAITPLGGASFCGLQKHEFGIIASDSELAATTCLGGR